MDTVAFARALSCAVCGIVVISMIVIVIGIVCCMETRKDAVSIVEIITPDVYCSVLLARTYI